MEEKDAANKHKLARKIIPVTGGTQGLGEEMAYHFAKCGASGIVFCGRNEKRGQKVANIDEKCRA